MNESDRQVDFNHLNKSATSLPVAIGTLGSPLKPCPERDLTTYAYSISTPIGIKTSLIIGSISDDFKKATTSLQEVTKIYASPLGSPLKIDLSTDLYSGSALAVDYDEMGPSDSSDLFRSLNT
jgi:hypothetical protein